MHCLTLLMSMGVERLVSEKTDYRHFFHGARANYFSLASIRFERVSACLSRYVGESSCLACGGLFATTPIS